MKIYYVITESLRELEQDYFAPSVRAVMPNAELLPIKYKPPTENLGNFRDRDYLDTLIFRSNAVLDLIKQHWNDYFILSDVDIVVVKDFSEYIDKNIKDHDILHQRDGFETQEFVNGGFTVIKGNERTERFYQHILDATVNSENPFYLDQDAIKDYYYTLGNPYQLKWDYLPWRQFATRYYFDLLEQSKEQLVLFHANMTPPHPDWSCLDQKKHYLKHFLLWYKGLIGRFY